MGNLPQARGVGLQEIAQGLATLAIDWPDLAERAARLADRIQTQNFYVAVLGDFNRGKSTLVNALIGRKLLPTGAVPLTAVPTEVHFGAGRSSITFTDGQKRAVLEGELADYVTERGNPGNTKGVLRVEVVTESALKAPGLVLVDTPGVASMNRHNTETALATLLDSDGALLVLAADSPLSESEFDILAELGRRRAKVFVVVSKIDHVSQCELNEVRVFITKHLAEALPEWSGPYFVSAGTVLERGATASDFTTREFNAFRSELEQFVRDDLGAARQESTSAEMSRLVQSLDNALRVEAAARAMDLAAVGDQLRRFEVAATEGRRQLAEDRIILGHEVDLIVGRVGGRLADRTAASTADAQPSLRVLVDQLPLRHLDEGLRDGIETLVRERFGAIWLEIQQELEDGWLAAASRFSVRVQERIDQLMETASELFDVHLPSVLVPAIRDQQDRFSYQFLHVEGPNAVIGRMFLRLLPRTVARRRALRRAERRLGGEFDKHAGRARYDMVQRIEAAEQAFAAALENEFEQTQSSLISAADAARRLMSLNADERAARERMSRDLAALVTEAAHLGVSLPAPDPSKASEGGPQDGSGPAVTTRGRWPIQRQRRPAPPPH
jgi:small GTP-binding protein